MRKKLFAILMSAMMMVTFMPSMAFAFTVSEKVEADTGVFYVDDWADDYTTVAGHYYTSANANYRKDTRIGTKMTLINDGSTMVVPAVDELTGVSSSAKGDEDPVKYVYDFNGFTMNFGKTMDQDNFAKYFIDNETGLVQKTTAEEYGLTFTAKRQSYDELFGNLWRQQKYENVTLPMTKVTLAVEGYDINKPYEDQTITITATPTPKSSVLARDYFGTIAPATVKVIGRTPVASDIKFYVDKVKNTADFANKAATLTYDGAAHTIVTNEVPGFTVSYEQVNATTNRYEAVTAASFKDCGTYDVRATVKNAAGVTKRTEYLKVKVEKAKIAATFGDANINVVMQGTTIDPMNFVKFTAVSGNANAKKAIAADEAALKAALATKYDIVAVKAEDTVLNAATLKALSITNIVDVYALKAVVKETYDKVAEKAYEKATANFTIDEKALVKGGLVVVVTGNLDNEIEFVQAPAVMKYHNKKGVLKKSYSFTVKAVATSGVAPTYKLINGNNKIVIDKTTGKITVKKGLKKGTYTVKVKAYGAAGNGYKAASETQTIKIVLTK